MSTPVLHVLAGPDGAGKSTFVAEVLAPTTHLPFVNADAIAAERWPDAQLDHAYDASRAAASERDRLIAARSSFITESVFSHPSKVELVTRAIARGYLVHLHVIMIPPDLPVARVAARVARGGHDVPPDKVCERYARLWPLVATARALADRTSCYDNSRAASAFRVVATYERGRLVGRADWPGWAPADLVD